VFAGCAKGIVIDYDKDGKAKRDRQAEKQRLTDFISQQRETNEFLDVNCVACRHTCMRLRLPRQKPFSSLPRRKTDHSIVVDVVKFAIKVARFSLGVTSY
jgi:hypothetical protein